MNFADIHIHALWGCDDGPETEAAMRQMVDMAYATGTRVLCLTPHYYPRHFGENSEKSRDALACLQTYAAEAYPDLCLYPGNELRFSKGCDAWLESGACRTLNSGRCVLVDFQEGVSLSVLENGLHRLLSLGYVPVLAHVERYRALWGKTELLRQLRGRAVKLQMDAGAPLGEFGAVCRLWSRWLLKNRLIDLVSSDGHDLKKRQPRMDRVWIFLKNKYGSGYAAALCRDNALDCLGIADRKDEHDDG